MDWDLGIAETLLAIFPSVAVVLLTRHLLRRRHGMPSSGSGTAPPVASSV